MIAVEPDKDNASQSRPSLSSGGRVLGFDLARSIALLGMIVVHFGQAMSADQSRPAWAAAIMKILDGRAAATFVLLAGIGVTLMSRRTVQDADPAGLSRLRWVLIRRGLFLLAAGMVNLMIWPGDILRVYGVSLVLAAGLVTAPGRWLLLAAAAFVVGFLALFAAVDYSDHWVWETMTYVRLWTPMGLARNLFYDGFRSVFPWTGLFLFGMWLGRRDFRDQSFNTRTLLIAAGVSIVSEAASRMLVAYFRAQPHGMDGETILALFGTESMPPLPLFLSAAGGTAVFVIALCVRLMEHRPLAIVLTSLTATGQMALTWYFAHIVLGLGVAVALGLTSGPSLPFAQGCGLLFFMLAVIVSWLWKKHFRQGPLEWLMRKCVG